MARLISPKQDLVQVSGTPGVVSPANELTAALETPCSLATMIDRKTMRSSHVTTRHRVAILG